jgi:predicted transglutaminase-like cysteine proteinase
LSQARLPFNLAKEVSNTERDIPRNANNQVLLDKLIWLQLQQVNRIVNSRIYPGTDEQIYGSADYWAVPTEFGDCEDYVLAKRLKKHLSYAL